LTTNAHSKTGQTAVCCQNLTLGALSRSALSVLVGMLFKKFDLFLNTPHILSCLVWLTRIHTHKNPSLHEIALSNCVLIFATGVQIEQDILKVWYLMSWKLADCHIKNLCLLPTLFIIQTL
jgi:hypothetical protein